MYYVEKEEPSFHTKGTCSGVQMTGGKDTFDFCYRGTCYIYDKLKAFSKYKGLAS